MPDTGNHRRNVIAYSTHQGKGDTFIQNNDGGKPKKSFVEVLQSLIAFLLFSTIFILVVCAVFGTGFVMGETSARRDFPELTTPRVDPDKAIYTSDAVFREWAKESRQSHVIDRKLSGLSLADSLIGDPSDHIFLGTYERERVRRKSEAALHFYLAAANGHPDGERLYKDLNIPTEDYEELYQQFVELHQMNGDLGLMRLGQYYLGRDAFKIARSMKTRLRFSEANDYIWPRQNQAEELAYTNFHMAALCGLDSGFEWRSETARFYNFTVQRENSLRQRGNNQLSALADRYGLDQDGYCQRFHLIDTIESMRDYYMSQVTVANEDRLSGWDGRRNPCDTDIERYTDEDCDAFETAMSRGTISLQSTIPTFRVLLGEVRMGFDPEYYGYGGGGRTRDGDGDRDRFDDRDGRSFDGGSQPYRNSPGSQSDRNIYGKAEDGLPNDCVAYGETGECETRETALTCSDRSKYHFNRGEADMAVGRLGRAREKFNRALSIGRVCQSEYAELAAKRLAALNLTCEYTTGSLARISRGYASNPDGGAIIDLPTRQRALRAKGYYEDPIDGSYGPATRSAVRQFQRELGFSETGDLTPIETVYLMCSASQVHADDNSMNSLGIMYVAGLGVVQNTDAGLRLLKQAAERGNADAKFNLSIIYGTGTVLSSYRLCGLVENLQIADAYLREAANSGHVGAERLVRQFGRFGPTERWERIRADLLLNDFYRDRLEGVGEGCRPNPGSLP